MLRGRAASLAPQAMKEYLMEYFPAPLEALVEQFARLPGIGGKNWKCLFGCDTEYAIAYQDIKQIGPDVIMVDVP